MNVIFIGMFYPQRLLGTIAADTGGRSAFANHNFEQSLISGLAAVPGLSLRAVSLPAAYSFPHNNRRAFIRREKYCADGIPVRSAGFFNLAGANLVTKPLALARVILSELKKFDGGEVHVIVNPHSLPLLQGLELAKKLTRKRLITTLVVPDVPACLEEMDSDSRLKMHLLHILNRHNAALARKFDRYVFLTEAMNDYYHAESDRYMVMEGLFDPSRSRGETAEPGDGGDGRRIILYTGSLKRIFGVLNLVEAFEAGNFDGCELWLCGSGDAEDEIRDKARKNRNIRFFGLVPSERALEMQRRATVLVNPRSALGNYTRYSFPSKTIEYLLSGKPVVMNRLPGIPAEYDRYLIYPRDESRAAWAETLGDVLRMSAGERCRRGDEGRRFILENKTAEAQCRRIIDFISK